MSGADDPTYLMVRDQVESCRYAIAFVKIYAGQTYRPHHTDSPRNIYYGLPTPAILFTRTLKSQMACKWQILAQEQGN